MIQGFQIFSVWMGTISGGMHLSGRAAPCAAMAKIAVAGQRLVLMIAISDPVLGALPSGSDGQAMAGEQAQLAAWKVRKTGYCVNISRSTSRAFASVAGDRCPRRLTSLPRSTARWERP